MEHRSLLNVLSPQLQALVEASLGEKLQIKQNASTIAQVSMTTDAIVEQKPSETMIASDSKVVKLNPSELFVLRQPTSPGYIVKENFLGHPIAKRVRDALVALASTANFKQASIGHGGNLRQEEAMRGDRIHWIERPKDLTDTTTTDLDPAILHLMRRVENLVFGVKKAIPEMDIRNVTSTQLAIFDGDGTRFVKHTDTYSGDNHTYSSHTSTNENLVRVLTCVYYLNDEWVSDHGGCLRMYSTNATGEEFKWDVPPVLDTLAVFRSTDVEHEVLPTLNKRMALTIWYYGPYRKLNTKPSLLPTSSTTQQPSVSIVASMQHKPATIFVAIPSYRDSECRHTVDSLFQQATYPNRISIGICLQSEVDDDTLSYFSSTYEPDQVRISWINFQQASGPCPARSIAQSLWKGEEYYLQIDSHMRVRAGWDTFLIQQLEYCRQSSEKPILTTYPLGYTLPNEVPIDTRPTLLCASHFDQYGMLRQASKVLLSNRKRPVPSLFWAAGFAFSSAQVIQEVPYDPSLRFLFFGEESSMSARLWTHGYDFFAPSETVIYHLWKRSYRPVFQELECDQTKQERSTSLEYVHRLLRDEGSNLNHFGLGSERSLTAYSHHLGINFTTQQIEWRAEWGNLDPIEFDLSMSQNVEAI